jgi:hypothetical protein
MTASPSPPSTLDLVTDPSNGADPSGPGAFERFESLTKRLVRVPKAEIDALKKREQQKKRRRASRKTA